MDEETEGVVPLTSSTLAEAEASAIPAVLPSDQMAMEIIKVLDLIAARLELQTPHPSTAKRVRGARTVPREFILSLLAAAERRPDSPLAGFDTARAREVLDSGDALRLLSERTTMFLASLSYTYEARWAEVAADALEAFDRQHHCGQKAEADRIGRRSRKPAEAIAAERHEKKDKEKETKE